MLKECPLCGCTLRVRETSPSPENIIECAECSFAAFYSDCMCESQTNEDLIKKVQVMENALRFYAGAWVNNSYGSADGKAGKRLLADKGKRAKEALGYDINR